MTKMEFFFDISSPWTYLAFARIEAIADKHAVPITWRPILVGGVFNEVNREVYQLRADPHPVKGRYYVKDLQDWARYCDIKIGMPDAFPLHAVALMRTALVALDEGCLPQFARTAFHAYWGELRDLSQPHELAAIATQCGMDANATADRITQDDIKTSLRNNTQDLINRGGFGSPTIFINKTDMYFGNDRLPLVDAALALTKNKT